MPGDALEYYSVHLYLYQFCKVCTVTVVSMPYKTALALTLSPYISTLVIEFDLIIVLSAEQIVPPNNHRVVLSNVILISY